ncbi:hypothetical protein [Bacillus toyonensis]|uniref:Uncharacterized protein n=1 Tax=Bacillus toyonensis TaxID=155322 RepID=A0A2A8HAL0_9BACI|nr:hypothetical protein [Bacillus toyonensis]PEQ00051.1 hypothetical protein CN585_23245 [Bacillus toyonensis]
MYYGYDYDEIYFRPEVFASPIVHPTSGVSINPPPTGMWSCHTIPEIQMPITYKQIAALTPQQKLVLMCWLQQG